MLEPVVAEPVVAELVEASKHRSVKAPKRRSAETTTGIYYTM